MCERVIRSKKENKEDGRDGYCLYYNRLFRTGFFEQENNQIITKSGKSLVGYPVILSSKSVSVQGLAYKKSPRQICAHIFEVLPKDSGLEEKESGENNREKLRNMMKSLTTWTLVISW